MIIPYISTAPFLSNDPKALYKSYLIFDNWGHLKVYFNNSSSGVQTETRLYTIHISSLESLRPFAVYISYQTAGCAHAGDEVPNTDGCPWLWDHGFTYSGRGTRCPSIQMSCKRLFVRNVRNSSLRRGCESWAAGVRTRPSHLLGGLLETRSKGSDSHPFFR